MHFWENGWYGIASGAAKIGGTVGFVLYAINLLLSVRRRWLERFFSGLNRVYIAHHLTGGIALILLTLHPLFLSIRYIELHSLITLQDAARALLPRAINFGSDFHVVQQQVAVDNGFIGFTGMVTLLVITFFINLPYRVWLFTHKFLGPAFFFAALHVIFISSDVSRNPFLKVYLTLWAIIGLAAFSYRTLFGSIFVRRYPMQVIKIEMLTPDVIALDMQAIEDKMPFNAGQFVFVRFNWQKKRGILPEFHPFSIASCPEEGVFRLISKAVGDHTKAMLNIQKGCVAEVEGAFGRFMYHRFNTNDQVWIAGGIGITPFIGMAKSLKPDSPKVHLFYSVINKNELVGSDTFASLVPKLSNKFTYTPFVTSETKKFITADYLAEAVGDLTNKEFFICGPPPMMKSLKQQLRAKGVKRINIHSEEFSMS